MTSSEAKVIAVYCPQERRVVGTLPAVEQTLTWRTVVAGFRPATTQYVLSGAQRDGEVLACPLCRAPLEFQGAEFRAADDAGAAPGRVAARAVPSTGARAATRDQARAKMLVEHGGGARHLCNTGPAPVPIVLGRTRIAVAQ
jgi:uncharacterized protein YbaR (Trm112 family)